ncbi:MAG TPA: TRAP transporter large permease [Egibacteraceae bacterium]|nr:TRAP transporter large permease [Egibacteraceae bacterium]
MTAAALLVLFLIIVGVPVAYAFGTGAFFGFLYLGDSVTQIPSVAYRTIDSFPLLAIPFFLLSGVVMQEGGVSRRLVSFVAQFTGRLRGGMGATLLGASAIFGAISGSSVATVSAMGSIMTPEMVKRGYPRRYVGGLVSVAGLLGILIPPSIPMVVYGVAANVSISDMFLAGLSAGLLLLVTMIAVNFLWAWRKDELNDSGAVLGAPSTEGTTRKRIGLGALTRTGAAIPALVMPVIILGGIYSGIFTPTEAGAAAVVYGFLVGLLVYRELRPSRVGAVLLNGILATTPILLIIAMGGAFSRALTLSGVPVEITAYISDLDPPKWLLLIILNLLLLGVGCFVEENTAIIILAPLLLPLTTAYGIDPVQFGVIMVLNLGIGLATPPMAPNVFVASRACDVPFHLIIGTTLKFLLFAAVPVLIAVNVAPGFSLWLTR